MDGSDSFKAIIAGLQADGMSYTEIAAKAGVSRATVWRMQNDKLDHRGSTLTRVGANLQTQNVSHLKRK